MAARTPYELWIGDRWVGSAPDQTPVRITLIDPLLRLIEAQDDEGGVITSTTIDAFVSSHHPLRRRAGSLRLG